MLSDAKPKVPKFMSLKLHQQGASECTYLHFIAIKKA